MTSEALKLLNSSFLLACHENPVNHSKSLTKQVPIKYLLPIIICVQSLYYTYFKEMKCNKKKDKLHFLVLYSESKLMIYTLNPNFWHFGLQDIEDLACYIIQQG